jgi:hypothetical protein
VQGLARGQPILGFRKRQESEPEQRNDNADSNWTQKVLAETAAEARAETIAKMGLVDFL